MHTWELFFFLANTYTHTNTRKRNVILNTLKNKHASEWVSECAVFIFFVCLFFFIFSFEIGATPYLFTWLLDMKAPKFIEAHTMNEFLFVFKLVTGRAIV